MYERPCKVMEKLSPKVASIFEPQFANVAPSAYDTSIAIKAIVVRHWKHT